MTKNSDEHAMQYTTQIKRL